MAVRNRKAKTNSRKMSQNSEDVSSEVRNQSRSRFMCKTGAITVVIVLAGVFTTMALVPSEESIPQNASTTPQNPAPADVNSDPVTETTTLTRMGGYELLEIVAHDPKAFTQGLHTAADGKVFYESTGLYGESSVRLVDIKTGDVLKIVNLEEELFGEGLTYYKDTSGRERLVVITWKEQIGIIYDLELNELERFKFTTTNNQGWGITFNERSGEFYVTDGTKFVHTWNSTWQEQHKVPVTFQPTELRDPIEVPRINEIEWDSFSDTLLANVWFENLILRIDVRTGFTVASYDLTNLYTNRDPQADVLNGIALTDVPNEIWVTGKQWPSMYRIRLVDGAPA